MTFYERDSFNSRVARDCDLFIVRFTNRSVASENNDLEKGGTFDSNKIPFFSFFFLITCFVNVRALN